MHDDHADQCRYRVAADDRPGLRQGACRHREQQHRGCPHRRHKQWYMRTAAKRQAADRPRQRNADHGADASDNALAQGGAGENGNKKAKGHDGLRPLRSQVGMIALHCAISRKLKAKSISKISTSENNIARVRTAGAAFAGRFINLSGRLHRLAELVRQADAAVCSGRRRSSQSACQVGLQVLDILEPDLQADERAIIRPLGNDAVAEPDGHRQALIAAP